MGYKNHKPPPSGPASATFLNLGRRTLRHNRTCLRAKNIYSQTPVLRFFNLFKERLLPLKVTFFFFN